MKSNKVVDTVSIVDHVIDWRRLTEQNPGEPMPTLLQAITDVENSQAALVSADAADQAADAKLKASQDAKAASAQADTDAIAAANAALDALISVATAAKR